MKNTLLLLFFIVTLTYGQGSGNCLDFDSGNDVVEVPGFPNQGNSTFTICAWVYTKNRNETGQRVFCDDQSNQSGGYAVSIGDPGAGRIRFYTRSTNPVSLDSPNSAQYLLSNNTWYHVAAVHDASAKQKRLYINGQLCASVTYTGTLNNETGAASIGGENSSSTEPGNRFNGRIDEVSFWSRALSTTEIRDLMCQSLTGSEANLTAYWNFDHPSGTTVLSDLSPNGYDGNLTNMNPATDWVLSGAAIGDQSTYIYTNSWGGQSITLNSTANGNVTVDNVAYSIQPQGIHLYRVDAYPNSQSGITQGLGSNNVYYGTFVADPRNYSYDLNYDYTNYPDAVAEWTNVTLYNRDDNSDATWIDMGSTNMMFNVDETGITDRGEFVIASTIITLPVEMTIFDIYSQDHQAILFWETESEINNSHFEILRSSNGQIWEFIGSVEGKGNSTEKTEYQYIDSNPLPDISYYRLKQVDFDGQHKLSDIRSFQMTDLSIQLYPNPTKDILTIVGVKDYSSIFVYDIFGRKISILIEKNGQNKMLSFKNFPKGVYFIHIQTGGQIEVHRIVSH
ncbi:MAG: LamG-like jellyroll fold domain-containing protein [Crocinitomicaceae bacterium]